MITWLIFIFGPRKNDQRKRNSTGSSKTVEQVKEGYDIAPLFREVLEMLPLEALDEMEKSISNRP